MRSSDSALGEEGGEGDGEEEGDCSSGSGSGARGLASGSRLAYCRRMTVCQVFILSASKRKYVHTFRAGNSRHFPVLGENDEEAEHDTGQHSSAVAY